MWRDGRLAQLQSYHLTLGNFTKPHDYVCARDEGKPRASTAAPINERCCGLAVTGCMVSQPVVLPEETRQEIREKEEDRAGLHVALASLVRGCCRLAKSFRDSALVTAPVRWLYFGEVSVPMLQ